MKELAYKMLNTSDVHHASLLLRDESKHLDFVRLQQFLPFGR